MSVPERLGPSSEDTRSAILDLIRSSGVVSRVELAEMSGLTPTSITRIVKSLIAAGFVVETGFGDSTGGKRPSLIELDASGGSAVGVALDDAALTYVATDLGGRVIGRRTTGGIDGEAPRLVMERIAAELTQLLAELDLDRSRVVGVGVAGAGLDIGGGDERRSLTADEWDAFALQEALESLTGLPVVRGNDAACAALGQFWIGRMSATQDSATLYLSNGFGLGIISGGRLSRGASSNVGEIGHMVVDVDGPECWCGSQGCLEMLAAPRAIVAQAMADDALRERLGLGGDEAHLRHDFDAIARAAAAGDAPCAALVERSARLVAVAVVSAVNLMDLDRIYLAGPGFADAGRIYRDAIRTAVQRTARTRGTHGVQVELSDAGVEGAAVGAAALALQHVLTPHTRRRRAQHGVPTAQHTEPVPAEPVPAAPQPA